MFREFFYLLRQYGLDVSLKEWLTLTEALKLGLHGSSMTRFYYLCRSILCKSEADYDKFEQAFLEYFHNVFYDANGTLREEIPEHFLECLNSTEFQNPALIRHTPGEEDSAEEQRRRALSQEGQALSSFEDTQKQLDASIYIGDHGISPFPTSDLDLEAIRVSAKTKRRMDRRVPVWNFKDFREDNVLSIRQFQMAFRKLCLYSDQFGAEEELDITRTIHDTCQKGGILQIRKKKPRRNSIKVLLFIDSGGTMTPYHELCSRLFQAASRSNRFRDLKIYYFHNCIDEYVYSNPTLRLKYEVPTQKVLRECDKDYRIIMVGDGTMDVNELIFPPAEVTPNNKGFSGQDWLEYILARYRHAVWLTPILRKKGSCMGTWGASYDIITDLFDMFPLTVEGLEDAMKKLLVAN